MENINEKSLDTLVAETVAGKYGNGNERKVALGSRYEEVQNRITELVSLDLTNESSSVPEIRPEKIQKFINEIDSVCKKYNLSISHEDSQGGFIIDTYDKYYTDWLNGASNTNEALVDAISDENLERLNIRYAIEEDYSEELFGWFNSELDAMKYCAYLAYKNNCSYHIYEIEGLKIDPDFLELESDMKYEYYVEAIYDDKNGWIIKETPEIDSCYFSEILRKDTINNMYTDTIRMRINLEDENSELAKSVACNYLENFKGVHGDDKNKIRDIIDILNKKFKLKHDEELERLEQERIKQEELAELARLKAKYESNEK